MIEYSTAQYLIDQINLWSQEKADNLHGLAKKGFPTKAKYIWEPKNTNDIEGFIFYGPDFATYMNAIGEEWVLSAVNSDSFVDTWNAYTKLYELATADNVRMVNPIGLPLSFSNRDLYKKLIFNDKEFYYYKLLHPDNELGWQEQTTADNVDSYMHTLINEVEVLIPYIDRVITELNNPNIGYPNWRMGDSLQNSSGRYYRWMFQWDLSKELFYYKLVGLLEMLEQTFTVEQNGFAPSFDLKGEALPRWQTALNM